MGRDKSLLDYHGMPQVEYVRKLLLSVCDSVWISCNPHQVPGLHAPALLPDAEKYTGIGPMASLLTAFDRFPDSSFLAVGCDYPFVDSNHLKKLVDSRSPSRQAVCYRNPETGYDEPLLALYENGIHPLLKQRFHQKKYSLRFLLGELDTEVIHPPSPVFLTSIDEPEEYEKARRALLAPDPTGKKSNFD
jgi:molybdopterin-guanine dinucleotide biosynthesis protein A